MSASDWIYTQSPSWTMCYKIQPTHKTEWRQNWVPQFVLDDMLSDPTQSLTDCLTGLIICRTESVLDDVLLDPAHIPEWRQNRVVLHTVRLGRPAIRSNTPILLNECQTIQDIHTESVLDDVLLDPTHITEWRHKLSTTQFALDDLLLDPAH